MAAVAELTERFQSSSGAVLTEYRGLSVSQLGELRKSLGTNATYSIVKNTITKIAATEAGVTPELTSLLSGPSAIAFVQGDVVGPPRACGTSRGRTRCWSSRVASWMASH